MRSYRDFDLEISDARRDEAGIESLRVRVAASPAGEQRGSEAVRVTLVTDLRARCGRLDRRELDLQGLVALGRDLGELLLPPAARRFFERSLAALDDDEGLRLRLQLDTWGIADLPWEFAWLPPAGVGRAEGDGAEVGGDGAEAAAARRDAELAPADASGFLALDPRISIVRYELLSEPPGQLEPTGGRKLRVVAMFASPRDTRWVPLDLEGEERGLRAALATRREIGLDVVAPATLPALERALLEGAQVFHFAGHGRFQAAIEDPIDTVAGKGFLIVCDDDGKAREVPAETVVVNLHGRGVRLAVLGACEGARRDRFNPWTGIAPALVRGGLPATVAMQATLYDRSAIAFSTRFYEALALGLPIDAAVSGGRLAIYNESGPGERDWGVPVLYLRAETDVLFPKPEASGVHGALEPLGARGWVNAGLSALALAALVVAFYLYVQPRFELRWLLGGGLSVAAVGGTALGWLQWTAGDEARAWVRGRLRRAKTTVAVAAAALLLCATVIFLFAYRPVVLRVLPGASFAEHVMPNRAPVSLLVWQGDAEEPTWQVERLGPGGAVFAASSRVAGLALHRSERALEAAMQAYLDDHLPVKQHADRLRRWSQGERADGGTGSRRRSGMRLRIELRRCGESFGLENIQIRRLEEADDHVELLFIEGNLARKRNCEGGASADDPATATAATGAPR